VVAGLASRITFSNTGQVTKRAAISLPDDLFRQIEHARARVGKDRSTWIQEAAGEYLKKRTRDEEIEAYFRGYERTPLTEDELSQIRWNEAHFGGTLGERVARPKRKGR
jgi:predicted DNA-binding protein